MLASRWATISISKSTSPAAAVYGHHGIVWRSAKVLFEAGVIATPEGVRDLVEAVYDETRAADLPEPLTKASRDAEGGQSAARSIAVFPAHAGLNRKLGFHPGFGA